MTTIATDGAPQPAPDYGGHRASAPGAWTDEQIAYALFLKNACLRFEVIAVEIGIAPHLMDVFVRDALVTIHRARHTRTRGRQAEAWIEAIARNLGRKRLYGAPVRGRLKTIFWSLSSFARNRRHREGDAETQRLTSAVDAGSVCDVTAVLKAGSANLALRTDIDFARAGACKAA